MAPTQSETAPIETVEAVADAYVRAIVRYGEDIDVVRMDEAAHEGPSPEAKLPVLRRVLSERFPAGPFGPHRISTHTFRDAIVIHVPFGTDAGAEAVDAERAGEKTKEAADDERAGVVITLEREVPATVLGELLTKLSDRPVD